MEEDEKQGDFGNERHEEEEKGEYMRNEGEVTIAIDLQKRGRVKKMSESKA